MNIIVLDTETTNSLEEPIAYDLGWVVIDAETGEILTQHSFAIAEVFLDKELMANAYFVEKVPQYWDDIKNGKRTLARFSTIYWAFRRDCKKYHIMDIYAHNMVFDDLSLKLTQRFLTSSKYRYFLPYGCVVKDTLKYSKAVLKGNTDYTDFCNNNGFKTKNHQNRYTAEILYKYLSGNMDFEEEHQGLDDVLIEKEILMFCLAEMPNFNASLFE